MRVLNNTLAALLLCLPFTSAAAAGPGDAMKAYLQETFASEPGGVAAIVTRDGNVVYRGAVGLDDIDAHRALSADQPFQIGSVTKTFVAATVLRLSERGLVDLDAPAKRYVPALADERITVRHLLTHRSGLPRGFGIDVDKQAAEDQLRPLSQYIEKAVAQDLLFDPGTSQMYSNAGYALLGGVIEAASGKPWHQAVVDEVIAPTGIGSIYFQPERAKVPGLAIGHLAGGKPFAPTARYYVFQDPAEAFVGDLDGLAAWFEALFQGRILSPGSLAIMSTPVAVEAGGTGTVAAGLMTAQVAASAGYMHSGRVPGYGTVVLYLPAENVLVGVFSNNDATRTPMQHAAVMLAAIATGQPLGAGRSDAARALPLEAWLGTYESGERQMQLAAKGPTGLVMEVRDGTTEMLAPAGSGVLLGPETGSRWAVLDAAADGSPELRWNVAGKEPTVWRRTGELKATQGVTLDPEAISKLVGTYTLPIGPFVVESGADGKIFVNPPGLGRTEAIATSTHRLVVDSVGMAIDFTPREDGRAETISISMGSQTLTGARKE